MGEGGGAQVGTDTFDMTVKVQQCLCTRSKLYDCELPSTDTLCKPVQFFTQYTQPALHSPHVQDPGWLSKHGCACTSLVDAVAKEYLLAPVYNCKEAARKRSMDEQGHIHQ